MIYLMSCRSFCDLNYKKRFLISVCFLIELDGYMVKNLSASQKFSDSNSDVRN